MFDTTYFVCFLWGARYPSFYVDRLYRSISMYFTHSFEFHCLTDKKLSLPTSIHQHELKMGRPFLGNWNKERVFSKGFLGIPDGANIVVMDVDVLVTGSLDFIITEHPHDKLVMAPDGNKTRIGLGHGSVFRVKAGSLPHVWDDLLAEDYKQLKIDLSGESEQRWLDRCYPKGQTTLFANGQVVSYKYHCKAKGSFLFGKRAASWGLGISTSMWSKAELPRGASVVCFHGNPDLAEVAEGRCGRWKHAPFINETLKKIS